MAQKEDESTIVQAAEFWTDIKAITRSTTKLHRIRWTIENVSQLPLDTKITGPDVYHARNRICNISFKESRNHLYIYICNNSGATIRVQCNLVLFDCEGRELHQEKMEKVYTLEENEAVDVMGVVRQRSQFDSLKDDTLIIDIILRLEGHVTTELTFFTSEKELRENLIKDLRTMFKYPVDSDFTLRIGDEFVQAHKSILRARSTYFKKMFEADMKESAENFVSIADVSHATMQKLVEFLYTGDFNKTGDDCMQEIRDLYIAADKYQVMDLRSFCASKLISTATVDNILEILQLAEHHNDQETKTEAMNFVSFHFDKIIKSNTWKTFLINDADLVSEIFDVCFKRLN